MGKHFSFWWSCVKRAAHGSSAFANNWQWLLGFPVLAAAISLAKHWLGEGAVSLNTDTALGALAAAGMAFIITWLVAFVARVFSSASNFYCEEKERADFLQQHIDLVISPRAEAKAILHQCYIEICNLFNESASQDDFDQYTKRFEETLMNQAVRIKNEFGTMAHAKFLDHIGINHVQFRKARGNEDYNNILMTLERTKDNLEDLIKSEVWNHIPMRNAKGNSDVTRKISQP